MSVDQCFVYVCKALAAKALNKFGSIASCGSVLFLALQESVKRQGEQHLCVLSMFPYIQHHIFVAQSL